MKTTKEWLESLPEPINHLALEAASPLCLYIIESSSRQAVLRMCDWSDSELGFSFWAGVYQELLHNESAT